MLNISISGYFSTFNDFRVKEILVSDEKTLYILKSSESFIPYAYEGNVQELFDSIKNLYYPSYALSKIKCHPDDDAKSLANFLMAKIQELGLSESSSHKKLFDVVSSFGSEC